MSTPTTIVTGFLGTGKTTAILSAFEHRPEGEKWAVIVNEFGEIGLDGAVFESGGVSVKEIPGGCICCTAGVALRFGLVEILRTQKPDRLFIEPTGLADPASILDLLRQPGIRDATSPRATIGIVDPRLIDDPRYVEHDVWQAQIALADVLVGGFADRTSPEVDARFEQWSADLWPPKILVARRAGILDSAWLDLDPHPREVVPTEHHAHESSAGWVFPRDVLFDADELIALFQELVRGCELAPEGLIRIKGIFRTRRHRLLVQATPTEITTRPVQWRRDSRVELIAAEGEPPDWDGIRKRLSG